MFNILFSWLNDVKYKFKLHTGTLAMTIDIIFRYYHVIPTNLFDIDKIQLSGICAMYIASLWAEKYAPEVRDFVYISAKTYTDDQVIQHTHTMLKAINGLLYVPGLNRVTQKLMGTRKEITEMLDSIKDFNDLLE